jgi:hypothetical protein
MRWKSKKVQREIERLCGWFIDTITQWSNDSMMHGFKLLKKLLAFKSIFFQNSNASQRGLGVV